MMKRTVSHRTGVHQADEQPAVVPQHAGRPNPLMASLARENQIAANQEVAQPVGNEDPTAGTIEAQGTNGPNDPQVNNGATLQEPTGEN